MSGKKNYLIRGLGKKKILTQTKSPIAPPPPPPPPTSLSKVKWLAHYVFLLWFPAYNDSPVVKHFVFLMPVCKFNNTIATKDPLSVWTYLGKHFVVPLVTCLKYKDRHRDSLCIWTNFPLKSVLNNALRKVVHLDS